MKSAPENSTPAAFPAPGEVRLVRLLPGPIDRVWAFLTDPAKRARWFCGGLLEQRAGGKIVFEMVHKNIAPGETPPPEFAHVQDPGVTFEGKVLRCEPPHLLVFTFGSDESEVTIELAPEGDRVRLVLTHRTRGEERRELGNYASGWHIHCDHLIAVLADGPRPPFWSSHRILKAEYERVLAAAS